MTTKAGILLLSHQGLSFLDDLMKTAKRLGLESYVLSSRPAVTNSHRRGILRRTATVARVTRRPSLEAADVKRFITHLQAEGREVRGCLSVWEGYRLLMSEANRSLGIEDVTEEQLAGLLDKWLLRQRLRLAGLSRIQSEIATPKLLNRYRRDGVRKFLKPRIGLGSFGAFALKSDTTWDRVEKIRAEMARDYEYRSLFGQRRDFLIEDYIGGTEASFEVLLVNANPVFLAVHEKVEVSQADGALLENASACPPPSLPKEAVEAGKRFLEDCFRGLGIRTGCFHVEAKYDAASSRWEIVEINPRVGGALIKESVKAVTGGVDLLEAWMRLLVAPTPGRRRQLVPRWEKYRGSPRRARGTFFRVYFGEPGRTIRDVRTRFDGARPKVVRVAVAAGARLAPSSRELFLGQALWTWRRRPTARQLESVRRVSDRSLEVTYEKRK